MSQISHSNNRSDHMQQLQITDDQRKQQIADNIKRRAIQQAMANQLREQMAFNKNQFLGSEIDIDQYGGITGNERFKEVLSYMKNNADLSRLGTGTNTVAKEYRDNAQMASDKASELRQEYNSDPNLKNSINYSDWLKQRGMNADLLGEINKRLNEKKDNIPSNVPPVTEPPATTPPVTEPPVTTPPVTEPPVTTPPVTEPPVTEPPVKQLSDTDVNNDGEPDKVTDNQQSDNDNLPGQAAPSDKERKKLENAGSMGGQEKEIPKRASESKSKSNSESESLQKNFEVGTTYDQGSVNVNAKNAVKSTTFKDPVFRDEIKTSLSDLATLTGLEQAGNMMGESYGGGKVYAYKNMYDTRAKNLDDYNKAMSEAGRTEIIDPGQVSYNVDGKKISTSQREGYASSSSTSNTFSSSSNYGDGSARGSGSGNNDREGDEIMLMGLGGGEGNTGTRLKNGYIQLKTSNKTINMDSFVGPVSIKTHSEKFVEFNKIEGVNAVWNSAAKKGVITFYHEGDEKRGIPAGKKTCIVTMTPDGKSTLYNKDGILPPFIHGPVGYSFKHKTVGGYGNADSSIQNNDALTQ